MVFVAGDPGLRVEACSDHARLLRVSVSLTLMVPVAELFIIGQCQLPGQSSEAQNNMSLRLESGAGRHPLIFLQVPRGRGQAQGRSGQAWPHGRSDSRTQLTNIVHRSCSCARRLPPTQLNSICTSLFVPIPLFLTTRLLTLSAQLKPLMSQ